MQQRTKRFLGIFLSAVILLGGIMGISTANAASKTDTITATIEDSFNFIGDVPGNGEDVVEYLVLEMKKGDKLILINDDDSKRNFIKLKVGIVDSTGKTTWSEDRFQKMDDTVSITVPTTGKYNIKIANTSNKSVDYSISHDPA